MTFGEKLVRLRKSAGYSQEDLAQQLNVTRQAVYKWESGTAMPDIDNIKQIASLFNISLDILLNDEATLDSRLSPAKETASQNTNESGTSSPAAQTAPGKKPAPVYGKTFRSNHTLKEIDIEADNTKLSAEQLEKNNKRKKINLVWWIVLAVMVVLFIISIAVNNYPLFGISLTLGIISLIAAMCTFGKPKIRDEDRRAYFFEERKRVENELKKKNYWYTPLQADMLAWFFYDNAKKSFGFYFLNGEQFICPISNYASFSCDSSGAGVSRSGTKLGANVVVGDVKGVGVTASGRYRSHEATSYSFILTYYDQQARTCTYSYELNCVRTYPSEYSNANQNLMITYMNGVSKSTRESYTKIRNRLQAEKNKKA